MGLPGHRRTSSHKRRRAAHFALKPQVLAACPKCKQQMLPHHACPSCGYYAGRKVTNLANPVTATSKTKAKKEKAHDHEDHTGHDHA